mmetsp:Transcript_9177/g.14100  ORF Transcript_9177/g.14100 Transcript_9177/m.14100 type:complete len:284 (+) Transcript_9177:1848-2699(+)
MHRWFVIVGGECHHSTYFRLDCFHTGCNPVYNFCRRLEFTRRCISKWSPRRRLGSWRLFEQLRFGCIRFGSKSFHIITQFVHFSDYGRNLWAQQWLVHCMAAHTLQHIRIRVQNIRRARKIWSDGGGSLCAALCVLCRNRFLHRNLRYKLRGRRAQCSHLRRDRTTHCILHRSRYGHVFLCSGQILHTQRTRSCRRSRSNICLRCIISRRVHTRGIRHIRYGFSHHRSRYSFLMQFVMRCLVFRRSLRTVSIHRRVTLRCVIHLRDIAVHVLVSRLRGIRLRR